jgi:hypothetical protein
VVVIRLEAVGYVSEPGFCAFLSLGAKRFVGFCCCWRILSLEDLRFLTFG